MIVRESLNEKSYNEFDINLIANKVFLELQAKKDFLSPYVSQYMHEEHNKFFEIGEDPSDILETEEFQNWLKYELEYRFDNLKDKFFYLENDGYFTLYRSMLVEDNYLNKLKRGEIKRIGIYWTWDIEKAEPHWGYGDKDKNNDIIFEIKIKAENINWVETFRLNLEHEFMNEEEEIRLFKNTPLDIKNIINGHTTNIISAF